MKIELKEIQQHPEILENLPKENQEIIITKNAQPIYNTKSDLESRVT